MLDPHKDALDRLHGVIADHLAKKFGKKDGEEEKKPAVVEVSITKTAPHEEPDGDEAGAGDEEDEKPVSPGAEAALNMLRMIHKR